MGQKLEAAILRLLEERGEGKTICPSEVAREVGGEDWRGLMEPVREAAGRLVLDGKIVATQRGRVVKLGSVKGPIRLRKA